jgi:Secretion system C-terminal sorting domain/SprB repeat/Periplasmic copper-binding protein (NosD)/Ig-like domain CHU_C associated
MKDKSSCLKIYVVLVFVLSILMSIPFQNLAQITSGTHTIGGTTPDFETITDAIDSLNSYGIVSGPVIFNIRTGTYTEQISLNEITNASFADSIIFQSATQTAEDVTIQYTPTLGTSNYVINLNGCNYVSFQYLTIENTTTANYGHVFGVTGDSKNINITNNIITGRDYETTETQHSLFYSYDYDVDSLFIANNAFNYGAWGIMNNSVNQTSHGIIIENNEFSTSSGIYMNSADGANVINNTINVTYGQAITLDYCDENVIVANNKCRVDNSGESKGISLHFCNSFSIEKGMILNNSIIVDGNTAFDNTGLTLSSCSYYVVYNNSVKITGLADSKACYINAGNNIWLKNNNFVNESLGLAIYSTYATSIEKSDYNNFFTAGRYLAYWGQNIKTFAQLQSTTGKDSHSLSVYPAFVSATDLDIENAWLDGKGDPTDTVPEDINGTTRDASNPDIGAFEFTAANSNTYSGTYSITGDFSSLSEAVDSLIFYGVSGPVTINIADGEYSEHFTIRDIPGADESNRIVFQSSSLDYNLVTLTYESSQAENYLVNFYGADYITFKYISFEPTNTSYAKIINLTGYAHDNYFYNNNFIGNGTPEELDNRTCIVASYVRTDSLKIVDNIFTDGSRSISLTGPGSGDLTNGLLIQGNTFQNAGKNIYIIYNKNFEISDNTMSDFSVSGIQISSCANPYTISGNELSTSSTSGDAFYIYGSTGINESYIFNNFIHQYNDGEIRGMLISFCEYQNIYHNSINIKSVDEDSKAIQISSTSNSEVKNNIFSHEGSGYAAYFTGGIETLTSDYNNFYSNGSIIGYWGGEATDFKAYQNLTPEHDLNSINVNPVFTSASDLHTDSYWLDEAGTLIAEITTDIDGDARDVVNPDIGADEYSSSLTPLAGELIIDINGTGDYLSFSEAVDDLIAKGISASVTFNVLEGTYIEQFTIPQIYGAGFNDTIVFQSHPSNTTNATLYFDGTTWTDNYIVFLDGADFVYFNNLNFTAAANSYATILTLKGNCTHNQILNCTFQGTTQVTDANSESIIITNGTPILDNTVIRNNTFYNGSYAINITVNGDYKSDSVIIENNTIDAHLSGIVMQNFAGAKIADNTISFNHYLGSGIKLFYASNSANDNTRVLRNIIYSDSRSQNGGIYILYSNSSGTNYGLIANNVIRVGSNNDDYSKGMVLYDSDYFNIYHNSVNVTSNDPNDANFAYNDQAFAVGTCNYLNIKNNIFAIQGEIESDVIGTGYAMALNDYTNITSDYNNLYSPGRYLAYCGGANAETLEDFVTNTGFDTHSTSYFPAFNGAYDLKTNSSWIDNTGTNAIISTVSQDIEGTPKNATTPDIGAYEFTSTQTPIPSGIYTLGEGGNFPSFDSLASGFMQRGIDGPITINVLEKTGYYNTHIVLKDIPGTSVTDTILIKSENNDPTNVVLGYVQTSNADNYLITLNGTDYITFSDLNFTPGGTTYSTNIVINGNAQNINILNNEFSGYYATGASTAQISIQVIANNIVDSLLVQGNSFYNNAFGIRYAGYMGYNYNSIEILDNYFEANYTQSYFYETYAPVIQGNELVDGIRYGMQFQYCDGKMQVKNNQIATSSDLFEGIYLEYCDGNALTKSLIANNSIQIDGSSGTGDVVIGIGIRYCNYQRIYHNSVNITGNHADNKALYLYYGNDQFIKNNIFYCANGFAIQDAYASNNINIDYNCLYTGGANIGNLDYVNKADFTTWQTDSGHDANSINVEPLFFSSTDLHSMSENIMGLGENLTAELGVDFDNEPRAVPPDIGADQIHCSDAVVMIADTSVCQFENLNVRNLSTDVSVGSTYVWDLNSDGLMDDTTYTFDPVLDYAYDELGSYTATLYLHQLGGCDNTTTFNVEVAAPEIVTAPDVYACFGLAIPNLTASGTDLKWYSDPGLTSLIATGENYASGETALGEYTYYITQTVNGCVSEAKETKLFINSIPDAPEATGNLSCGENIQDLTATGSNINWYSDGDLLNLAGTGNTFATGQTSVGIYDYYATQTIFSCESEADTVTLTINAEPAPPIANDLSGCQGDLQTFNATGTEVQWYSDGELSNLVYPGNSFATGISTTGNYTYYVTQTVDFCESKADTVLLTIFDIPVQPITENISVCESQTIPNLTAYGENVQWYSDPTLLNLINTGTTFDHGMSTEGTYNYYVTQTINNCVSNSKSINLSILFSPSAPVVTSASVCSNETIPNLEVSGVNVTWYSNAELTDTVSHNNIFSTGNTQANNYVYYVTQNNGQCPSLASVSTLEIKQSPNINEFITNIDCQGNDYGAIHTSISGGNSPFYYNWSNGNVTNYINNLASGDYSLTVTDSKLCTDTAEFIITKPDSIYLEIETTMASCEEYDGSAEVFVNGGIPPYEYHWSNGVNLAFNDTISAGVYIVTVTDNIGCSEFAVATINDLEAPTINLITKQNVSCFGNNDGGIYLTVTEGAEPYEYIWSNGAITEDVNNLYGGSYELQVIDNAGCMAVESFNIDEPDEINIDIALFDTECDAQTGSATAVIRGGIPDYNLAWSIGSNQESVYNLGLGTYSLTVTDNNSCAKIKNFAVSEIGSPYVGIDSIVKGKCDETNGGVYITSFGNNGPRSYSWSNETTNEDLVGVNPGYYFVTVSDNSDCAAIKVANIEANQPQGNPLCIVTVDTATVYNEIVWQKEYTQGLHHYNLYKESTQSDNYFLIASIPVEEESFFVDSFSNSLQRSWRYKLSVVDSCGVESELSENHKTMHLTVNVGVGGNINLIWDHYEGIDFDTYYIYRNVRGTGWELLDEVPDNLTSYTDFNPPGGDIRYFIELRHPYGCEVTKATNRNNSRSNVGSVSTKANSEKEFLSYGFINLDVDGTIDNTIHTINFTVPEATDITNLIAEFTYSTGATVKIGDLVQESGVTSNDFTSPVVYSIEAEDGSIQNWTVTVTVTQPLSSENDFLFYAFDQSITTLIDTSNHTVTSEVYANTDLSSLTANFVSSQNSVVMINDSIQESGITANNFTVPVTYTIMAEDSSLQEWTVSVIITETLNSGTDFLTFSFHELTNSIIDTSNHTVNAEVFIGTNITNLVATFTSSPNSIVFVGDSIQESGVTANDFTSSVIYTILAEDSSSQDWTITISQIEPLRTGNDFILYMFTNSTEIPVIDTIAHTVVAKIDDGLDITNLVAKFIVSDGATAYINNIEQISEVTANDFTYLIIYNIVAEDGSEQLWIVDVLETGLNQLPKNEHFNLYPNPNTGEFSLDIDLPGETEVLYSIYTFEGKLIETNEIHMLNKTMHQFDLSQYEAGIYYMKLITKESTYNFKIMIQE